MKRKNWLLMLAVCLALCAGIFGKSGMKAEAASSYKQLFTGSSTVEKSGKYYFKMTNGKYYVSTKKGSGYTLTPISGRAYSNGKQVYYTYSNILYKYVLSSGKNTKLKTFKTVSDDNYYISTIYGNKIFVTRASFDAWKYWTYMYNTDTKKTKKILSNCTIEARYGKYVVGAKEYRTDVAPYTLTLYKITSKGLSRVKKLTSYGKSPTFAGGKLYYVVYPKDSMEKATLYRCSAKNGKSKKLIKTFKSSQKYTGVYIYDITSKSCKVSKDNKIYKYTYKTNKLTKLN